MIGATFAISMIMASAANTGAADAYVLNGRGCRYDPKNDNDGLGIAFNTSSPGYNSTENLRTQYAASDWNARMTPQFTIVTPYSASIRDLRVEWAALGTNVGGVTTWWCGSDHYTQDPLMKWSTNETYYVKTQDRQVAVAVHEIGHSYGVAHNQTGGCNGLTAGLMFSDAVGKNGACGWTNPTSDDVNGATRAHNGQW